MSRIYLDSAPLIYLVEGVTPYADILARQLAQPGSIQVCSELSRLECRVKPIREKQESLLAAFDNYFASVISDIIPLTRLIIDQATEIRAGYGFRTPDAIHLAAAIQAQCDLFLTNDRRLEKFTGIKVAIVSL